METDDEVLAAEIAKDEIVEDVGKTTKVDPDEFYRDNAFRVVYQTNNFLLPQISELITAKKVINIRPEYQRRLRWSNKQNRGLLSRYCSIYLYLQFFSSRAAQPNMK